MTEPDWWDAALMTAPAEARLTGETRLQQLGLDIGAHRPLHLVLGGRDLHRDVPDLMLHRTDRMPEHDDVGVHPAAAFIESCRRISVIDAVAAGDWLLHHGHMSREALHGMCRRDDWRDGSKSALWILPLLDERSASIQESRYRLWMRCAGLPRPEVNGKIVIDGRVAAITDWIWRRYRVAAEYEGGHHQTDRGQYLHDLGRYRLLRRLGLDYEQITKESRPETVLLAIHRRLAHGGYVGPAPRLVELGVTHLPIVEARVRWPRPPAWSSNHVTAPVRSVAGE